MGLVRVIIVSTRWNNFNLLMRKFAKLLIEAFILAFLCFYFHLSSLCHWKILNLLRNNLYFCKLFSGIFTRKLLSAKAVCGNLNRSHLRLFLFSGSDEFCLERIVGLIFIYYALLLSHRLPSKNIVESWCLICFKVNILLFELKLLWTI